MATVEHELLKFFASKGEATLREAIDEFGVSRRLSRGAIVKMTDRLLKKGLLKRRVQDHVYVYEPSQEIEAIEVGYVGDFVRARLKDSVSPLLAFLSNREELSEEERESLQKIAERIEQSE